MHEDVGAGESAREHPAIALESDEANAGRSRTFQRLTLGSVPEEDENGVSPRPDPGERPEDDVPALLEREAADADEDSPPGRLRRRGGPAARHRCVPAARTFRRRRRTGRGRRPRRRRRAGEPPGRAPRRTWRRTAEATPGHRPHIGALMASPARTPSQRASQGSTYVPTWSACRTPSSSAASRPQPIAAAAANVRRVGFEHLRRPFRADDRSDLGRGGRAQMVGAVVREWRARRRVPRARSLLAGGRLRPGHEHPHRWAPGLSPGARDPAGIESDLWTSDGFEPHPPFPNRIQ